MNDFEKELETFRDEEMAKQKHDRVSLAVGHGVMTGARWAKQKLGWQKGEPPKDREIIINTGGRIVAAFHDNFSDKWLIRNSTSYFLTEQIKCWMEIPELPAQ